MEIILASGSPRRRELLGLCCPDFRVEVSGADEHVTEALSPEQLVARLAEKLSLIHIWLEIKRKFMLFYPLPVDFFHCGVVE